MNCALNPLLCKVKQSRCALLPAIALALSVPARTAPTDYTLTIVATTGDTISGKTLTGFRLPSFGANSPAINSKGNVAFYATYAEGVYVGEGIFTPTSLVLKTGDVVKGQSLDGIDFVPAFNDAGTVVARGLLSSGASAVLTTTALLAKTGDTIGGQTLTDFGIPAIDNNGRVAFVGSFSGGAGIFTRAALLAKSGQLIDGQKLDSFGSPVINDRGMVAFQSWSSGGIASGIFTPTALLVKTGDTIRGKTLTDLFFAHALNSAGTVAFIGVFSGGTGVFTQKSLLVQAGDTIGGQTLTTFGSPVINDSETVAFFATTRHGAGIFSQTSLIVKTGDAICGRTVIGMGQPAINSDGLVVFPVLFSDDSSAIMLARPKVTPAPSRNHSWPDQ